MENESGNVRYREVPPEGASGRDNPPKEDKPNPPVDRPVYAVPKKDTGSSSSSADTAGRLNFKPLLVAGMIILAIVGTYIYSRNMVQLPVHSAPAEISTNRDNSLKVETLRTIGILSQIEAAYTDNPEKLEEVKSLKDDAEKILELLENEIREE